MASRWWRPPSTQSAGFCLTDAPLVSSWKESEQPSMTNQDGGRDGEPAFNASSVLHTCAAFQLFGEEIPSGLTVGGCGELTRSVSFENEQTRH